MHNYSYDKIGNLVADKSEEIEEISWTMQGKVKRITRLPNSQKPDLVFNYDGLGNRVSKTVIPKSSVNNEDSITTYYVRDAQGNILATYEKTKYKNGDEKFYLKEQYLYGSSRIGMNTSNLLLASNINGSVEIKEYDGYFTKTVGNKRFELTNHLGNVLAIVSDKKGVDNEPDVISLTDYYPFGMTLPGRSFNANSFRFGYTGHEKENEIAEGTYGTEYRLYDSRRGVWLTMDQLAKDYPDWSPYSYGLNNPLKNIDPDGRAPWDNINIRKAEAYAEKSGGTMSRWQGTNGYEWASVQTVTTVKTAEGVEATVATKVFPGYKDIQKNKAWNTANWAENKTGVAEGKDNPSNEKVGTKEDIKYGVAGMGAIFLGGVAAAYLPEIIVSGEIIIKTVSEVSTAVYMKTMSMPAFMQIGAGYMEGKIENSLTPFNPDASPILPLSPLMEVGRQLNYFTYYGKELINRPNNDENDKKK